MDNTQPIMGRRIKMEANIRCDWDHQKIDKGSSAYQVVGDETILAQGLYHGRGCYGNALADYQKKLKGVEESV